MRIGTLAPRLAVGLTRVSTAEQGQSGLGLEAQQASIRSFVASQGWTLVAERTAHRLHLQLERLRAAGIQGHAALARALNDQGVRTPRGIGAWTHTAVARVLARAAGV